MSRDASNALSHVSIYLVARGLPGLVAFLAIPVFTGLLAAAEYGQYVLVVGVVNLLNALLFQWLRLSLVRYLPAYRDDPGRLRATLAAAALVLIGCLGAVAAGVCLLPAAAGWRAAVLCGWAVLSVQALFELACEHARAAVRPWRFMAMQLAKSGSAVGLGAGLLVAVPALGWAGPLAGGAVGMAVAVAAAYRLEWRGVRLAAADRATLAQLAWYGVPLSLTVALAVVVASTDRFLIAGLTGEAAAGLYAAAADFAAQTLTLLMNVVSLAMFPLAVRAFEADGPDAAKRVMRTNASVLLAIGVPAAAGMAVLSPGVAHCFFGADFRAAAADLVPVVALGAVLAGFKAYHFDSAFQFAHRTIQQVWIVLAIAVLNAGLGLVMIPRWGVAGAAWAAVGAYAASLALTVAVGRRHFAVPFPGRAAGQVLLAAGVMAAALYPTRGHVHPVALAGQIVGGVGVYGAVLLGCDFLGVRATALGRWRQRRVKKSVAGSADVAIGATLMEAGA